MSRITKDKVVTPQERQELLQAISSGHDGCLAVVHASSPTDAVSRLELMTLSRGLRLPLWAWLTLWMVVGAAQPTD